MWYRSGAVLKTGSKPSTIEVTEPVTAEINKTEPVTGTEATTSNPLPTSNDVVFFSWVEMPFTIATRG